jgi:methionyl-tRNA formyltransferase
VRLAFLGTPASATPTLRAVVAAGHEVAVVVTRPDRRRGRGEAPSPSPVQAAAAELGLEVVHDLAAVSGRGVERGVVVAYGALVPAALLDEVPMLNVHFSLLPRWRGAAPVERAILAGDVETGVSVMSLEATLDTGPVHARASTPVDDKTSADLTAELAGLGARALVEVLGDADALDHPVAQSGEATYAAKVRVEELHLEPGMTLEHARRVARLGRAFTVVSGRRLRVARVVAAPDGPAPGKVAVTAGRLLAGFADGALELAEVVPDGGRAMPGASWWNGARLSAAGAHFT